MNINYLVYDSESPDWLQIDKSAMIKCPTRCKQPITVIWYSAQLEMTLIAVHNPKTSEMIVDHYVLKPESLERL